MDVSKAGLELIKSFEGLRLEAYKAVKTEKYYTIGYGHYGPDVTPGLKISKETAEKLLYSDLAGAVHAVNSLFVPGALTQGQFDALVSFTYNCGAGNLKKLCNGRNLAQIRAAFPSYNKSGGTVLTGLIRRRAAELKLWDGHEPAPEKDMIKGLQRFLNNYAYVLSVDGIAGPKTKAALVDFLNRCKVEV